MYLHEYNNTMYNQLIDYKQDTLFKHQQYQILLFSSSNPIFFSLIENREMLLWD